MKGKAAMFIIVIEMHETRIRCRIEFRGMRCCNVSIMKKNAVFICGDERARNTLIDGIMINGPTVATFSNGIMSFARARGVRRTRETSAMF